MSDLWISEKLTIPESEFQWTFARSSGPGGQNVNKVNSKATLRWVPQVGTVPTIVWRRFCAEAKRFLTTEGHVVIQSQEHRDQPQNVEACRDKLRTLLQAALVVPKIRKKTRPSLGSKRRRLDNKRKNADKKSSRNNNWSDR